VRYVLLYREQSPEPDDIVAIESYPGVKILEHAFPGGFLIEASKETADRLRSELTKWIVSEERTYSRPHVPGEKEESK
jgi:hypothetical protein